MSEPYLILHKVRGEPAFDVAIKIQADDPDGVDEEVWIIPTSGHRAYPYTATPLATLATFCLPLPIDWPDHYSCNEPSKKPEPSLGGRLLERLGLVKPFNRRV